MKSIEPSEPTSGFHVAIRTPAGDYRYWFHVRQLEMADSRLTIQLPNGIDTVEGLPAFQFRIGACETAHEQSDSIDNRKTSHSNETTKVTWRLENLGAKIQVDHRRRIETGGECDLDGPTRLTVGDMLIEIVPANLPHQLQDRTHVLANGDGTNDAISQKDLGAAPSAVTLALWFNALGELNRKAAGTSEFFEQAAKCLIDPGGLDAGMILQRDGEQYKVLGAHVEGSESMFSVYPELIQEASQSKQTVFQAGPSPNDWDDDRYPMAVCVPLVDDQDQSIGVVYGIRTAHRTNQRRGIRPLEAKFARQVGETVAAGITRLNREAELVRRSVLLEQVFPANVIDRLMADPHTLDGHQREMSVMFCDIRDFTRICDRLEGRDVYQLLSQIMDYLTERVRQYHGVVIDYFGDGLAAFWNAPFDQPNHATLACSAAVEMLEDFDELSREWLEIIGTTLRLGIGIHTGVALVGNSGSKFRIKYGPRGQTVNLASRIEQATKHVGTPILISDETAKSLDETMRAHRVCRALLPGVQDAVELHRPVTQRQFLARQADFHAYEQALNLYEQSAFSACCQRLEQLDWRSTRDQSLIDGLLRMAKARRDGNFNRRRGDDRAEFMALAETAAAPMYRSPSNVRH